MLAGAADAHHAKRQDVERAASALVEKGYSQIKTQMAVDGLTPKQEVERISLIRDAVGPNVNLMVDINQRWSVAQAISIGHRVEDLGLGWLEDPDHLRRTIRAMRRSRMRWRRRSAPANISGASSRTRQAISHHSSDITMRSISCGSAA